MLRYIPVAWFRPRRPGESFARFKDTLSVFEEPSALTQLSYGRAALRAGILHWTLRETHRNFTGDAIPCLCHPSMERREGSRNEENRRIACRAGGAGLFAARRETHLARDIFGVIADALKSFERQYCIDGGTYLGRTFHR